MAAHAVPVHDALEGGKDLTLPGLKMLTALSTVAHVV